MNKNLSKLAEISEIPREIVPNVPKIQILNGNYISIENHKGIICYTDTNISLRLHKGYLIITGLNIVIKEINAEIIELTGDIMNVKFENME